MSPMVTCAGCGDSCDVRDLEVEFCIGRGEYSCCADCRDGWHDWCGHTWANGDRCFCCQWSEGPEGYDDGVPEQVGPERGDPQPVVVVVEEAEADEDPR